MEKVYYWTVISQTDGELIEKYKNGDSSALEQLFSNYLRPVYSFVHHYVWDRDDAADITQDVFLRTWKHIRKFDTSKKFSTWIFAIAKNTSLNWIKKKKPQNFSAMISGENTSEFGDSIVDPSASLERILDTQLEKDRVDKAFAKLKPNFRVVILLRIGEGLEFHEIAEQIGEPLNTVKSSYRRALEQVQKELKDDAAPNLDS